MLLIDHFAEQEFNGVVVAPDLGSAKRARAAADRLHMPLAITEKRRSGNEDQSEVMQLIGEVAGRDVLIIDDEIDTAGTLVHVAELLRREGAQRIFGAATHGVLSDPALERLDASPFSKVVVTDTLPPKSNGSSCGLEVVSIAPLLGEAIRRIHEGDSVGALFR